MTLQNFQLVMRSGPSPGKIFMISQNETVIGRDVSADVVINSAEVSRRHTRLRVDPAGHCYIEDLGSTNGTFVNGQRISVPQILHPGDTIMLGDAATLTFETSQSDPGATMISPASDMSAIPVPASREPQRVVPSPQAYAGQVPSGPAAPPPPVYQEPPPLPRGGKSSWLWAGSGCLVVMLCGTVIGALIFDMLNLYCVPPFNALFSFLYTCP
ncbi:MAG TPA: FHA domain-containing protein [Anaerolineales bacterium]|nr:FHA domain-containing protein [Anaerolineales bacterium]